MKTIQLFRKKTIVILPLLAVITMAISCSEESLTIDNTDTKDLNFTSVDLTAVAPTTVTSFDPFSGQLPESIDVDHFGNIYVSMPQLRQIWKLDPDGDFEEVVASFPIDEGLFGVNGLRFDARGDLYASVASFSEEIHGFWKISPGGAMERITGTGGIALPNDVAISPNGTVYMTDSAGAVWRYMPGGQAEIWIQDETLEGTGAFGLPYAIGANGIVIVSGKKMPLAQNSDQKSVGGLLVSNSEKGQLVYVPILPDGSAGEPNVIVADLSSLFGLDGITLDARGNLYGAVNAGNSIVRISRDGTNITEIASGAPLDFPAGLAFGTGRERHTLFIVNFSIIHFLTDPPMPGNANPAIISLHVDPGQ